MKKYGVLLTLLMVSVPFTQAQWVGTPFVITDAPGAQHFPDVAYNSQDHTFLVVWEAVLEEEGDRVEIQGALIDSNGETLVEPFVILEDPADLRAPEIAYNSVDNEFLVVARVEGPSIVLAQLLSGAGDLLGNPIELETSNGPTFFDPAARARVVSVVHNAVDNRYFVAFGGQPEAQILFPNLDLDIPIPRFAVGTNPSVSWSSESNVYLMAWEDREARGTGSENLSAQLFSNDGAFLGDLIRIRDQDFAEESPRVAYNPGDDEFLVIWDERIGFAEGNNTLTDTIGQKVKPDGTLLGGPIPIEAGTAYTLRQDVDYSSYVGFLAVWKGDESGNFAFADIWGGIVPPGEFSNLPEPFLIFDGGDDETDDGTDERFFDESKLPVVATEVSGNFLVVWEEAGTNRNPFDSNIMGVFTTFIVNRVEEWMLH